MPAMTVRPRGHPLRLPPAAAMVVCGSRIFGKTRAVSGSPSWSSSNTRSSFPSRSTRVSTPTAFDLEVTWVITAEYSDHRMDSPTHQSHTSKDRRAADWVDAQRGDESGPMSYLIWLAVVGFAGWASGEIAGGDGFGTVADVLLGVSGAFVVRFATEQTGTPVGSVYLLLFSIWGAAAPPAIARLLLKRHQSHSKQESREASAPVAR
jgi:uncharacterized membrane protein YeaQ/YmgE (transglycosylase-associated protein family)